MVDIGQGCWRKMWHLAEEEKCGVPLWHCPWDFFFHSLNIEYYRGDIYSASANWNIDVSVFVCPAACK